jgi:hypothetical protein
MASFRVDVPVGNAQGCEKQRPGSDFEDGHGTPLFPALVLYRKRLGEWKEQWRDQLAYPLSFCQKIWGSFFGKARV